MTVHSVNNKLHHIQLYTVQCIVYTVRRTLYTAHYMHNIGALLSNIKLCLETILCETWQTMAHSINRLNPFYK